MEELKPCPFCGGEADVIDEGKGTEPERYWAYCGNVNCFVEGTSAYATEREAIEAWNTRHSETCQMQYVGSVGTMAIFKCSECGAEDYGKARFCRLCGAEVKQERGSNG